MKNWRLTTAVLLSLLMLTGFETFAQRGPGQGYGRGFGNRHGFRQGSGMGNGSGLCARLDAALDLSDEQESKVNNIFLDFQKDITPFRNEIMEKRVRLHTLMTTDNPDRNEINQLTDRIGVLQASIQKARVDMHLKIRNELTEEQKVKFDAGIPGRFGRGGGNFGYMGMRGRSWN